MEITFGSKPQTPPKPKINGFGEVVDRVKYIENRITNMDRKIETSETNLIRIDQGTKKEISDLGKDIMDVKHQIEIISQKIELIIKELKLTAGKEELQTVQKYLDFWNPVNFITYKEAEKLIEEKERMR